MNLRLLIVGATLALLVLVVQRMRLGQTAETAVEQRIHAGPEPGAVYFDAPLHSVPSSVWR